MVHHTNKPAAGREKADWKAGDNAYLGSGSNELANWPRAVIGIKSVGEHDVFQVVLGKRGKRAGIVGANGEPIREFYIKHASHGICWELAGEDEAVTSPGKKPAATVEDIYRLIPLDGAISQPKLFNAAEKTSIGEKVLRNRLAQLIEDRRVFEWRTKRPGTRPAISYSRRAQELADQ